MTTYLENLAKKVELEQHILNGKKVELCNTHGDWINMAEPEFCYNISRYRKKTEPELIQLDPSDIELGKTVIRIIGSSYSALVLSKDLEGVHMNNDTYFRFSSLKSHYERLIDGEWVPCSKESTN